MMKRYFFLFVLTILGIAEGWCYTIHNLPMVPLQYHDSTDFNMVCNPDGILSVQEADSLNAMLWNLRQTKGVQGLVVCIREMEPDDPYEFGIGVFNKYGVGGKTQNAGFLVLLATENRAFYINTGEGMEKYLTDAQCATIERRYMVPSFKEGRWGEGIIAGVAKICDVCSGQAELGAESESEFDDATDEDLLFAMIVVFGPIILCLFGMWYNGYRKRKCPVCGKHRLRRTKRIITKVTRPKSSATPSQIASGMAFVPQRCHIVDYYTCGSCGHVKVVESDAPYNEYKEGTFFGGADNWGRIIAAAAIYQSGYGRGRGGGSSFGGGGFSSFGGGFSSGGGAGGRF